MDTMKQIALQETKQKWKTFADICPIWADIVKQFIPINAKYGLEDSGWGPDKFELNRLQDSAFKQFGKSVDIDDAKSCIVGEANLFNLSYWDSCSACREFAALFVKPHTWIWGIPDFVRHWNEEHVDACG